MLLATGDAYWGNVRPPRSCQGSTKPWTMGWQPDYPGEAKLYAKYILAHKPSAKIGVLYQNDAYGKNYLAGFKNGPRQHDERHRRRGVVQRHRLARLIVGAHVAAAQSARSDTVRASSRRRLRRSRRSPPMGGALHWTPLTFLNNVSANRIFMLEAESLRCDPGRRDLDDLHQEPDGSAERLPAMKLAKTIIYATGNCQPQAPVRRRRQQPGLRARGGVDVLPTR